MSLKNSAAPAPHSWAIESWPETVYPGTPERGRYLVRIHKQELLAAGALCRPGRELVVIGARFTKWLERKATRVPEFDNGAARTRNRSSAQSAPGSP